MVPLFISVVVAFNILRRALSDPAFRSLAMAVALVLAAGTIVYPLLEGWSVLDAFYFSVVCLTTVGFGDFAPETAAGKLFTVLYIFVGLGFIMAFVTTIVQRSRLWYVPPAQEQQAEADDTGA